MQFELDTVFKAFLDQLFLAVLIINREGRIVYYNKKHADMDELTPEDTLGYKICEAYSNGEDDSPSMKALKTGRAVSRLMTYKTARGRQLTSLTHSYPMYRQNELIGVINVVTDVTSMASTFPQEVLPEVKPENREDDQRISFDSLIGKSPLFREAVDVAKVAADGPSPVMLIGETGTGKDLFARAIHDYSPRADGKYIAVNCSAIPEALLEGILFGTTKGAFTGATDREGLLEHASGGTLFLDEINSMPLALQTKLLRVLQDHRVRRVGGLSEKKVDLRLISASNVNPLEAVANQSLRADLYYRLGVVQVRIPPLRKRPEDIPYLARYFIDRINLKMRKKVKGINDSLLAALKRRPWPGNVRELEHVIESAMNFVSDGEALGERHFRRGNRHIEPFGQSSSSSAQALWASLSDTRPYGEREYEEAASAVRPDFEPRPVFSASGPVKSKLEIERDEKAGLITALTLNRGIIRRAAAYLGWSPQLTSYRMKKYKLNSEDFRREP